MGDESEMQHHKSVTDACLGIGMRAEDATQVVKIFVQKGKARLEESKIDGDGGQVASKAF